MLSFGGDIDDFTNPFEVPLDKYVDLDLDDEVIGINALQKIAADGPKRHQLGIVLDDSAPLPGRATWYRYQRKAASLAVLPMLSGHRDCDE